MNALTWGRAAVCACNFLACVPSETPAQPGDSALYCIVSPEGGPYVARARTVAWTRFRMGGGEAAVISAPPSMRASLAPPGGYCVAVDEPGPGEELYLVRGRPGLDIELLDRSASVIVCDGYTALVRSTPAEAERIATVGMRLRAVLRLPSVAPAHAWPLPPPEGLSRGADMVPEIVDRVTEADVSEMIGNLSGVHNVTIGGAPYTIATRNSYKAAAIAKATQYAYEYLRGQGLSPEYHDYTWDGNALRNVYAVQEGDVTPGNAVIVCAHLDDMPNAPLAPGADDNASGSTAVLLAASALKDHRFERTIVYVLFTGEEQGLVGSQYFVADLPGFGWEIQGALNFDMIAYDSDGDGRCEVYCGETEASGRIADLFVDTVAECGAALVPAKHTSEEEAWSDHFSFWDAGYPAITGIEADADFNTYYHTEDDTRDHCALGYATDFVRVAVGTLARAAVPAAPPLTPTPTPSPGAEVVLNGSSFAVGGSFCARFLLHRAILQPFTAYAVIFLPDRSMIDAATLGPVRPVVEFMPALGAPFSYTLLCTPVPLSAPKGECEIVAAFFDPYRPIAGRPWAFLEASAPFRLR